MASSQIANLLTRTTTTSSNNNNTKIVINIKISNELNFGLVNEIPKSGHN